MKLNALNDIDEGDNSCEINFDCDEIVFSAAEVKRLSSANGKGYSSDTSR